ncbi:receptor-type tyrosine-protein phosphatase A [Mytilus galloprovincialis]|uniref:protein-tyrosine-phosphatase n=1 Tax=Mytilus galloprovincialis TaxID=29158 RepID=A0A8B6BGI8_MYTGA|nr:receptor-type tyrosine-protein phosphatase A [Mytilus galloprovincialis]
MDGFKLYITNTSTIPPTSYLCYEDPDPGLPSTTQTISCNQLGQYVIYYDDKVDKKDKTDKKGSIIELCYVSINGCRKNFWGRDCASNCSKRCIDQHCYPGNGSCVWGCNTKHCLNDLCNKHTAVCSHGCEERRTGTYCNKYNIATDGLISHVSSVANLVNLANDGNTTSCFTTQGKNIQIQVDMKEIRITKEIYLTGRVSSTSIGMGYTIYASNSSRDPEKGTVLSRGLHLPKNITTNFAFRYLTYMPSIKSASVDLEICEIGIVGCPSSNYGKLCEKNCPKQCRGPCDLETGRCLSGCSNGWIGEKCEAECSSGFYGRECLLNCSINCLTPQCDHTSGKCISGCTTGWRGFNCTQEYDSVGTDKQEDTNGSTIGGIIGAIIVVILIISAVCVIYKHKSKSTNDTCSNKSKSSQRTTFNQKGESSNEHEYVNAAITSEAREITVHLQDTEETELPSGRNECVFKQLPTDLSVYKINVQNLKKVIKGKRIEGGYKNEYEILPKGLVHPHVEGSKEENKVKNRFLTTWPYDHSRIVLKGNKKTDYINANYIDNYDKEKAYIAAQGPKKNTVRDFWHMIWQENVGKIVMVTQLKEGSREKCVQYWPDAVNDPMVVHNYRLTMTKEKENTLYVYRLMTLSNNKDTSQTERTIHHFHFIQWPDHGVPDSIQLVHFYRKVKLEDCDQYGPMAVHCSAGVGRTGTFIAIDALYEHGKKVNYVNVMEYVQMMRKDRMNMIQTPEQYETVFEALLELFTVQETNIQKNDFSKHMEVQERTTLPTNQKVFKQQFEGYREESRFFVTQCPMKDTVVDFYTMIYDHNSRIIVLLDQVNPNAKLWLGRPETLVIDDFSIQQEEDHTMDKFKIALKYKTQQDKRLIHVFTTNDWQGATLPSTKLMVDLLKSVVNCWKSLKCPITVVCRDGCTNSGLFVALYLLLDKIEIDEEIDVFQVVRKIQTRRPEFLKTSEQYEYCYQCIKELLEGESMYANT